MIKADIIEFIEEDQLLGDKSLSPAQKVSLKLVYGLGLSKEELEIYRQITGRTGPYIPREWEEVTFILGRRSGKSDKLASNICLYEACAKDWKVSVGETPCAMLIASEVSRQTKILFDYVVGKLERSPELSELIDSITADEVRLTNGVLIACYPCLAPRVRGRTLIFAGCDEIGHWRSEGFSADSEVLEALRPGLMPGGKLVKISTPGGKIGELWTDHKTFFGVEGAPVLVVEGSTELFNPAFSKAKLWAARLRGKADFEVEYLGRFREKETSMFLGESIDKVTNFGRMERLPEKGYRYLAFVDVSGGHGRDFYAIAIGHIEEVVVDGKKRRKLIVDLVRSRKPPFDVKAVTEEYCDLLASFGIKVVTGDASAQGWPASMFASNGIKYENSDKAKSQLYIFIQGVLNSGGCELPCREPMLSQFKSLHRFVRSGGHDKIDTPDGSPEDEANAVAGLLYLLDKKPPKLAFLGRTNVTLDPDDRGGEEDEEENLEMMIRSSFHFNPATPRGLKVPDGRKFPK